MEAELAGVGHDADIEGLSRERVDRESRIEEQAGQNLARRRGARLDQVVLGEAFVREVVIDVAQRARQPCPELLAGPEVVSAVDKDRRRITGKTSRRREGQVPHKKSETARHRIGVRADHGMTQRAQHAGQRDLRTDAIAVRTRVPHDRHGARAKVSEQALKALGERRGDSGGSVHERDPDPWAGLSGGRTTLGRRPRATTLVVLDRIEELLNARAPLAGLVQHVHPARVPLQDDPATQLAADLFGVAA